MRDDNDNSWFMFTRGILKLYSFPFILELLGNPCSKTERKRHLDSDVNTSLEESWVQDI